MGGEGILSCQAMACCHRDFNSRTVIRWRTLPVTTSRKSGDCTHNRITDEMAMLRQQFLVRFRVRGHDVVRRYRFLAKAGGSTIWIYI